MCSCTWNFTCSRCKGTPFDPRYLEDEPEPLTDEAFSDLVWEYRAYPIQMLGEEERP